MERLGRLVKVLSLLKRRAKMQHDITNNKKKVNQAAFQENPENEQYNQLPMSPGDPSYRLTTNTLMDVTEPNNNDIDKSEL